MKPQRGPFKKQSLEILKERNIPIHAIIDVGVQKGTPELVSAFPTHKHYLFEPVEEFFPSIESAYSFVDHTLFKVAVGDEEGRVRLKTSRRIAGMDISHSSMVFDATGSGEDTRMVPVVTLDSVLSSLQSECAPPYLLKIDIDGHEMRVLRGASSMMSNCSVIIIECVYNSLSERIHYVTNAGFRLFDLAEPCYYDQVFWSCDAIFLRKDLFQKHFTDLTYALVPGMYKAFR